MMSASSLKWLILPLALTTLSSCRISDKGMDFSPARERMAKAETDEVIIDRESGTSPVSTIAVPPATGPSSTPSPELSTAAEPKATVATPTSGSSTYTVRPGDSMGRIAARHGVSLSALCAANGLTPQSADRIRDGQKLRIPSGAAARPAAVAADKAAPKTAAKVAAKPGSARTHTVQKGDTINHLAAKYHVPAASIIRANGITPQNIRNIRIGSQLTIPAK